MTLRTFRDTIVQLAPPWLRGYWSARLLYAFGLHFDAIVDAATAATKARFPGECPPDALPYIGRERGIRRGFAETDEQYAARLTTWIDDRRLKGGYFALMRQLQGYCTGYQVTVRMVVSRSGYADWFTFTPSGGMEHYRATPSNWDWDGATNKPTRVFVILYPAGAFTGKGTWGDGSKWGDRVNTWGMSATRDQVRTLEFIVREWMPPHAKCGQLIVALDPASFAPNGSGAGYPDGTWDKWHKTSGGVAVKNRLDTARYLGEP